MLQKRSLIYFFLSLLLHIVLLFIYLPKINLAIERRVNDQEKILKVFLDTKKQIVRSKESEDNRVKEDSYLSDKTRSFERQTVARKIAPFSEGGGGEKKQKSKKELKLSDLGFKKNDNDFVSAAKKSKSESESSTSDHIENVALGDTTYLNTIEFKYYGFYFRIRQRLEQFWGRSIHETAKDLISKNRIVARDSDHITALRIVLDGDGQVTAIKVLGSSGISELDNAAIRAFNEAGPFPNPPKGMIVKGKVTLQWGFVVKT